MKLSASFFSLLLTLVLPISVEAQMGPTPGSTRVKPTFDRSDLVCVCLVKSVTVRSEQPQEGNIGATGHRARQQTRATVEIVYAFKSDENRGRLATIQYVQDALQPVLFEGEKTLLFLKSSKVSEYTFVDGYLTSVPFGSLPHGLSGTGFAGLRSALVVIAQQSGRDDQLHALQLLQGFDTLDQ